MTAYSITRASQAPRARTLGCQKLGGCSAKAAAAASLVAALVVAASLFCVWSRTEIVRQGYAFSEMAQEIKTLTAEQERLRVDVVRLRSPDRIESIASHKLGMTTPGPEQIRVVEYQSDRGLLADAGAARGRR